MAAVYRLVAVLMIAMSRVTAPTGTPEAAMVLAIAASVAMVATTTGGLLHGLVVQSGVHGQVFNFHWGAPRY